MSMISSVKCDTAVMVISLNRRLDIDSAAEKWTDNEITTNLIWFIDPLKFP